MVHFTEITDRITLVVLDIRIWSGRKKLRAEDLHLADGAIPPEELVSLGSKRVCDPEPLKPFHRLKQAAERACLRIGTRFLGGFAVPNELTAGLAAELDRIKAEFERQSASFIAGYDHDLERWIGTLPAFEAAIRRAVEPAEAVAGRLRFTHQLVAIKPAQHPGTLAEEVLGLGDGVFAEVEQMARDLVTSFEGKDKLHRRALGTFTRVREKLACLSFVDPRIQPIVESLDDWLGRLPLTDAIAGTLFNEGLGLALLLSDAKRMSRHGAGQLGQDPLAIKTPGANQPVSPPATIPPSKRQAPAMPVSFDGLFETPSKDDAPATPPRRGNGQRAPESFFF